MKIFILLWFIYIIDYVCGGFTYKTCKISNLLDSCPESAKCVQSESRKDEGLCKCIDDDYEVNGDYFKNPSEYCIKKSNLSSVTSNSKISTDNNELDHIESSSILPQSPSFVDHHHVFGGILIPLTLICLILIIIVLVKKFNIIQRIRLYQMSRRNRPFYEDVMMNPPLV